MTESGFPPITSPTANVDVPTLLAELAALKDELEQMNREQRDDLARFRAELADEREEHAARARAGELGREWMTLQRRVDMGETTVDAVVRGEDDSAQAEVVRGFARENADTAAEELDAEIAAAERGPVVGAEPSPAAAAALAARAEAAELIGRIERLRALPQPGL